MTSWKITIFNRRYIFKWLVFHCHVSFPGVDTQNDAMFNSRDTFSKAQHPAGIISEEVRLEDDMYIHTVDG